MWLNWVEGKEWNGWLLGRREEKDRNWKLRMGE